MYLSELFLHKLENGMEKGNVIEALDICNRQFCMEMDASQGQQISEGIFFMVDKEGKITGLNKKGQELLDFWDAYKEFDEEITEEEKSQMQIVMAAIELRARLRDVIAME